MPKPAGQAHPNIFRGFIFYMKAYFTVLISKWNNFKLLMLSTLLSSSTTGQLVRKGIKRLLL